MFETYRLKGNSEHKAKRGLFNIENRNNRKLKLEKQFSIKSDTYLHLNILDIQGHNSLLTKTMKTILKSEQIVFSQRIFNQIKNLGASEPSEEKFYKSICLEDA